jgi:hypothetical protein
MWTFLFVCLGFLNYFYGHFPIISTILIQGHGEVAGGHLPSMLEAQGSIPTPTLPTNTAKGDMVDAHLQTKCFWEETSELEWKTDHQR